MIYPTEDRPALTEIEITDAMVAAGIEALRSIYDYELSTVSEGSLERAATEVFQTMAMRLS